MQKEKVYSKTIFSADIIKAASVELKEMFTQKHERQSHRLMQIVAEGEKWKFDSEEEFFAAYRRPFSWASYAWSYVDGFSLDLAAYPGKNTIVAVQAPERHQIAQVFNVFEAHAAQSVDPTGKAADAEQRPVIFIGHGRSKAWRDLKDHLTDQHGYQVEAYETGARAGHTIRDVLEDMLAVSSFALLVMTAEDEMADGSMTPRLNVVHEAGLFQGKLGFSRAIIVLEEGAHEFSNIHGVQQLRFSQGNIREVFGDILATLRREFHLPARQ